VAHSALRRRILYSQHERDVAERLVEMVGSTRAAAWGRRPDMTANPAWYICSQLAGLYRGLPEIVGDEAIVEIIADTGRWQLASRLQRDTIGMNDMFLRVDIDPDTGEPSHRLVFPDQVQIVTHPLRPSQPLAVLEWIEDPDKPGTWVRLTVDPRAPTYRATADDGQTDVTERVLGGRFDGEAYPWRIADRPVLPYVAYHAAESGFGLDPYSGREVFEGVLQLGVYYSFFGHVLRNAAWSQRFALGAAPVTPDVSEDGRRQEITTDPAVLLILQALEDAQGQPQIGQFANPIDADRMLASIERYEQRVVDMALGQVGVSRRQSDVRSAMALAVSRDAQREAQQAYEPVFRRSDLAYLRLVSGLMGGPVDGWRIRYAQVAKAPDEMRAEMERMAQLIEAGLLDKVTAYQELHPGLARDEATKAIEDISRTNKLAA